MTRIDGVTFFVLDETRVPQQHSLEHLGQVSQVESVVTLRRSGQQRRRDRVVDADRSLDDVGRHLRHAAHEAL